MIDKPMWQRGLLALLIVVAVGLFYAVSQVQESSGPPGANLVLFEEEALPASSPVLVSRPKSPADEVALLSERTGVEVAVTGGKGVAGTVAEGVAGTGGDGVTGAGSEGVVGTGSEDVVGTGGEDVAATGGDTPVLTQAVGGRSSRFDEFRISRTLARSRRIEALEESLAREDLTPEARSQIQAELFSLLERAEVERQAEGLLVARGLTDAIVFIGNQGAEVIVPDTIDREDAGRIGDLIARVAGVSLDRITIVDGASI